MAPYVFCDISQLPMKKSEYPVRNEKHEERMTRKRERDRERGVGVGEVRWFNAEST